MYLRVGSITADLHFPAAAISGLVCEKNSFNSVKRSFRVRAIFRLRYLANVFFAFAKNLGSEMGIKKI